MAAGLTLPLGSCGTLRDQQGNVELKLPFLRHRVLRKSVICQSTNSIGRNLRLRKPAFCSAWLCHTVSTISERNSVNSDWIWRLDKELDRLKNLHLQLQSSSNFKEKLRAVNSDVRVQAIFNFKELTSFWNPLVNLLLEEFSEREIYLLKCLVAIGQEHVLDLPASDCLDINELVVSGKRIGHLKRIQAPSKASSTDILKGTFYFMTQLIESWEDVKQSQASKVFNLGTVSGISSIFQPKNIEQESYDSVLQPLRNLLRVLDEMERFYDCIGGIIGYQIAALTLIKDSETAEEENETSTGTHYHVPHGVDLSKDLAFASEAAGWGVTGLPEMGEIYPLGGAGDRLGLVDAATGECLPVAMLPYCGRTLLEGLIRDLQAREYLYYKIHGKQAITPVAIMTSAAKRNNERVKAFFESHAWFGRGRKKFRLFDQPLVPTVAAESGLWVTSGPLNPVLKPGGHGVIWKLANDMGVFKWFNDMGRKAAIVRQISNPVAATDVTLLALSGVGLHQKKKFGFASCERKVGSAEGVNILMETKSKEGYWNYGVTCIEYTEFNKLGIPDIPTSTGSLQARFPANTNVLYVDLKSVEQVVSNKNSASLPGIILNMKKPLTYTDCFGVDHSVRAGRVECTMQNVADSMQNQFPYQLSPEQHEKLDTFMVYNKRSKVTSSAKRRRKPGDSSLHQTPDGSFLDVTRNAFELLSSCSVEMPEMEGNHCYADTGPPFIVLFHPALGPLWDVIRQKIRRGSISRGSEVQLEVAELSWEDVHVNGSLLIHAENIMGSTDVGDDGENLLTYGKRCGRCRLERVEVKNKGIDWKYGGNIYWQNKIEHLESLSIKMNGHSEFYASDVTIEGNHSFEVPDGHRMTVKDSPTGLVCRLEALPSNSWHWAYSMEEDGVVQLQLLQEWNLCGCR